MTPDEARLHAMEIVGPGVASGRIALDSDTFAILTACLEACGLDAHTKNVVPEGYAPVGYVPGTPLYRMTVGGVRVFVRPVGGA
jgi:hypothetical protein